MDTRDNQAVDSNPGEDDRVQDHGQQLETYSRKVLNKIKLK